jgi:hypothetical protein
MPGREPDGLFPRGRARSAGRIVVALALAVLATVLVSVAALADGWPPGQPGGTQGHDCVELAR